MVSIRNLITLEYAGHFVGVVGVVIAVYVSFFRDTRPALLLETVSNTAVFDVRESLRDLQILYGGKDLRQTKQALSVIVVRVENDGVGGIRKGDFDDEHRFTLRTSAGRVIRADVVDATSAHLAKFAGGTVAENGSVELRPVSLEAGQSFTLKLLALHPESERPKVEARGKVFGVIDPRVLDVPERDNEGFWGTVTTLFFMFGTLIGGIASVGILAALISTVVKAPARSARRRHVEEFKRLSGRKFSRTEEYVLDNYVSDGELASSFPAWLLAEGASRGGAPERWAARRAQTEKVLRELRVFLDFEGHASGNAPRKGAEQGARSEASAGPTAECSDPQETPEEVGK